MKSLLIRFFVSFWLIIGITIGIAAIGGYWYAERVRDAWETFESDDVAREASAALESAGREGLVIWLKNYPERDGMRILVLERNGRDLLGRPVPRNLLAVLNRQRVPPPPREHDSRDPDNLRRARPLTQLVGPDGARYTFVLLPSRRGLISDNGAKSRSIVLLLTLIVSAGISYLLARTLSRPIRQLRSATQSLAAGDLDSRVAPNVSDRKDELGLLGRDFDAMAQSLQKSAAQQTELSRNVSHELRSPLARLRVALELARRKSGDLPEFDRIDQESERLDELIGQILSYSRIDGIGATEKRVTRLDELLSDVANDVNFECRSNGMRAVSVETELEENVSLTLHADSIRSAIENVLRNAVRHSADGSSVTLRLTNDSSHAHIVIEDKGPGVAAADLGRLFEPFFRTRRASAEHSGTGLGLAIARRAVELHGGSIKAENREQGGLRMRITLPA